MYRNYQVTLPSQVSIKLKVFKSKEQNYLMMTYSFIACLHWDNDLSIFFSQSFSDNKHVINKSSHPLLPSSVILGPVPCSKQLLNKYLLNKFHSKTYMNKNEDKWAKCREWFSWDDPKIKDLAEFIICNDIIALWIGYKKMNIINCIAVPRK